MFGQGILKGEVSPYHWPPVWLVWNQTTDNFCFYLQNRLIQTNQTGGQWYSDTSPFSISWFGQQCLWPTTRLVGNDPPFGQQCLLFDAVLVDQMSVGQMVFDQMTWNVFFSSFLFRQISIFFISNLNLFWPKVLSNKPRQFTDLKAERGGDGLIIQYIAWLASDILE